MRVAIITGASSGLGRTFAKRIAKLYKNLDEIWVIARREERLLLLKEEISLPVRCFVGDLTKDTVYETLKHTLEKTDADIRVLVNAAGFGLIGDFDSIDLESQLRMIDLNCRALTKMTGTCLPCMSEGSRVIQVASAAAFGPQPGFAVYAASKAYVYSFSLALRSEWKKKGISVTCVCPGPVATEFFEHTGKPIKESKKKLLMEEEAVVKIALKDARKRKAVSIPGLSMKGAKLASKVLPDTWIAAFMKSEQSKEMSVAEEPSLKQGD